VLQACWRWLWNARNDISRHDLPQLLNILCGLVNAVTEAECQSKYSEFQVSALSQEYPQFAEYVGASAHKKPFSALNVLSKNS